MTTEFTTGLSRAEAILARGRFSEAEGLFNALLAAGSALPEKERGLALCGRGAARCQQGRQKAALADLREAVELLSATCGPDSVAAGRSLMYLGRVQTALDDLCAGCATGRQALRILDKALAAGDPLLAEACFLLSQAEYQSGRLDRAEALTRRAMEIWEKRPGTESAGVSTCLNNLGRIYEERGLLEEGIGFHRRALAMRRRILGEHPETAFSLGNLGTALASAGQWAEAAEVLEECVACYARLGIDTPLVTGYRRNLEVCRMALADPGVSPPRSRPS